MAVTAPDETPSELDPLLREALAWVIRLHSGEATIADGEAVQLWRQSDPRHEEAFRAAVRLWRTFGDGVRALEKPKQASGLRTRLSQTTQALVSRRGVIGAALAASAAGYFCINPPLDLWPSLQELTADYRTAKGEQRDIVLSKDLSLKLNTQTSIAVRATQDQARIELISGEAAINATASEGKRVVILAAGGQMTATHANFDASCLDGIVSVSCFDGAVDVEHQGRSVQLTRDQQVSYSAAKGLGVPEIADAAQATAWQAGLLIVHDRPLVSVVDQINRYRHGKIIVLNGSLGRRRITGTFHLDRLDDFIGQVHGLFGATARYLPGNIVLLA